MQCSPDMEPPTNRCRLPSPRCRSRSTLLQQPGADVEEILPHYFKAVQPRPQPLAALGQQGCHGVKALQGQRLTACTAPIGTVALVGLLARDKPGLVQDRRELPLQVGVAHVTYSQKRAATKA